MARGDNFKKIGFRYKKLNFWNKWGFWGSLCSILGLVAYAFTFFLDFSVGTEQAEVKNSTPKINLFTTDSNSNSVELAELIRFFMDNKGYTTGFNWSHGTFGEIPHIEWSKETIADEKRLSSIKRKGEVFIKIDGDYVNGTNAGIPYPWNIELIGFDRTSLGYDEIHFESGFIVWDSKKFESSLSKLGIHTIPEYCHCCMMSVIIHSLSHEKYGEATLIENVSSGMAGSTVDLFLYPFSVSHTCQKIYYNNYLISDVKTSTLDKFPEDFPVRLLMGWTRFMDKNMDDEIKFLNKYLPRKKNEETPKE